MLTFSNFKSVSQMLSPASAPSATTPPAPANTPPGPPSGEAPQVMPCTPFPPPPRCCAHHTPQGKVNAPPSLFFSSPFHLHSYLLPLLIPSSPFPLLFSLFPRSLLTSLFPPQLPRPSALFPFPSLLNLPPSLPLLNPPQRTQCNQPSSQPAKPPSE